MTGFQNALAQWTLDQNWINQTFQRAHGKDLVTFDIFDTCLTRNVDSPVDIFARVEKYLLLENKKADGFAQARENAEIAARHFAFENGHLEEITLDEIYAQLRRFITLSAEETETAKATELKMEQQALFPVCDILSLTEKLNEANIAYSFVSDMYLPKEFLQQMLTDCGYRNWNDLIVSCNYRKTKASGTIWGIKELKNRKILHIGDNHHSDIATPQKYGIETQFYARAHCQPRAGCTLSPAVLPFSTSHRYTEMALRANPAFSADPEHDWKRMYALGQSFGVMQVGAFILWLIERAQKNNITHLAFCARDGWLMRKAWHILTQNTNTSITDSYLYVSRKVLTLGSGYLSCTPDHISSAMLDFLIQYTHSTTIGNILERIKAFDPAIYDDARKIFSAPDAYVRKNGNQTRLKEFLAGNSKKFHQIFQEYNREIIGYFTQERLCEYKRLGIVDMGWNGTMQRGIRQLCRQTIPDFSCMGFYYGLWNSASGNRYAAGPMESAFFSEFDRDTDMRKNTQGVDIIEELHSAPGGSTARFKYIDGRWEPVTSESPQERKQFDKFIEPFQKGVLDGLNELVTYGRTRTGLQKGDLTTRNAFHAYRQLFLSPTTDEVKVLSKIAHGALFDHTLTALCDARIPVHPKDYQNVMWNYGWTIGLMKQWLTEASPSQKNTIRGLIKQHLRFLGKRELRQFDIG